MAERIAISKKAEIDLERIIEFNNFRNQSDTYSKKLLKRLIKRLKALMKQPLSGLKTDESNTLLLIWDNYYVFYNIDGDVLEVTSIYHQKENI